MLLISRYTKLLSWFLPTMVLLYIFTIQQIFNPDSGYFTLDSVYTRYHLVDTNTTSFDTLFTETPIDTDQIMDSNLRISGTKDISFDMSQGFNQGLQINMRGEIEGVTIEGALSDKATPSSTIPLSEIERLYLRASTNHFSGALGDLSLTLPFGLTDEIQGARISLYTTDKQNIGAISYALNRGKLKRLRLSGEEGKQSPYFLDENIVVGSEKVYLAQGMAASVLLMRDTDYNIDYENGVLSFTNKNIITNHSRIEVEYQKAQEDYQNTYLETDGTTSFGPVTFTGMFRERNDQKNSPLSFTLSPAEIESLSAAGDSATVMHTFADTAAQGDYILNGDHFVYAGQGQGNYNVTFFYVGENQGDYIYEPNIKAFLYQGPGAGNYTPTKYIPLPAKDRFYGLQVSAFKALDFNIYGSDYDKNTFSINEDFDNYGKGYSIDLHNTFKSISIQGQYLYYGDNFVKPDFNEAVDYYYQWNTNEALKEMGNLTLIMKPVPILKIKGGYGILNRKHKRQFVTLYPFFFFGGYEKIDTLERYFTGISKKISRLTINSKYENHNKLTHLFTYEIKYSLTKTARAGLTGSYDQDSTDRGITTAINLTSQPLNLTLGHRLYQDTTFLFGNLLFNLHYHGFLFTGNLEQSQRHSQKRDETYIKVDPGTGNFVYDPETNTYIEKEGGDYIKKIYLLKEFERTVSRNYNIEAQYTKSIVDITGRFSYAAQKDFQSNNNEISATIDDHNASYELIIGQDMKEDRRYLLYNTRIRERFLSFLPAFDRFAGQMMIKEVIEEYNDLIREKRQDYGGNISYRVIIEPLIKPLIGYTYSSIISDYFSALNIELRSLTTNLLIGIPVKTRGRIEFNAGLVYRLYNIENLPYFFSAAEPAGLTKILSSSINFSMSSNTILSLLYRIEFRPVEKPNQHLRFQTKIRF